MILSYFGYFQVCLLTFGSWISPITKIDLAADKKSNELMKDSKRYFVNTGEWKLINIQVEKVVKCIRAIKDCFELFFFYLLWCFTLYFYYTCHVSYDMSFSVPNFDGERLKVNVAKRKRAKQNRQVLAQKALRHYKFCKAVQKT